MSSAVADSNVQESVSGTNEPPFYVSKEEERELRLKASHLSPSLTITQATSFDEYARQLMVPPAIMDLARKASSIRLATWEIEGLRAQLEQGGFLREILEYKVEGVNESGLKLNGDKSHPPYIRVTCDGNGGDYDDLAMKYLRGKDSYAAADEQHVGDYGSPVVLEIWPAQHYSPIHSHGNTTGIIYCLAGQVDVMAYSALSWSAEKRGLLTLTPGQCAWLAGEQFAVHRVYCPMNGGSEVVGRNNLLNKTSDYAATFHVYLNEAETGPEYIAAREDTREVFNSLMKILTKRQDYTR